MNKNIAVIACMDDDNTLSNNVLWIGTPGSYVTVPGDTDKFPKGARELVEKYRPLLMEAVQAIAKDLGVEIVTTSHEGCGALAIQGVEGSSTVETTTREFVDAHSDMPPYTGHIRNAGEKKFTHNDTTFEAEIERPESSHEHHAKGIVFTVGGFLSGKDMQDLKAGSLSVQKLVDASTNITEQKELRKYFVVSADWVSAVVRNNNQAKQEVIAILQFITNVALSIMHNTLKHITHDKDLEKPQLELVLFDKSNLDAETVQLNAAVVREAVSA